MEFPQNTWPVIIGMIVVFCVMVLSFVVGVIAVVVILMKSVTRRRRRIRDSFKIPVDRIKMEDGGKLQRGTLMSDAHGVMFRGENGRLSQFWFSFCSLSFPRTGELVDSFGELLSKSSWQNPTFIHIAPKIAPEATGTTFVTSFDNAMALHSSIAEACRKHSLPQGQSKSLASN